MLTKTKSLAALKRAHEAKIERLAAKLSLPFQQRARWLLGEIKKEIPALEEVVYCNGDSWLRPEEAIVPFIDRSGKVTGKAGARYDEKLRHVLDAPFMDADLPAVSAKCLRYIRELYDLTGYCEDNRMHTLEAIAETVPSSVESSTNIR